MLELQEALDIADDKLHDAAARTRRLEAENAELHIENKRLRRKNKKGASTEEAQELRDQREEIVNLRDQREDHQEEIDRLTLLVEEGAGGQNWQARAEELEAELEDAQEELRELEGELAKLEKELADRPELEEHAALKLEAETLRRQAVHAPSNVLRKTASGASDDQRCMPQLCFGPLWSPFSVHRPPHARAPTHARARMCTVADPRNTAYRLQRA